MSVSIKKLSDDVFEVTVAKTSTTTGEKTAKLRQMKDTILEFLFKIPKKNIKELKDALKAGANNTCPLF